jgi:hypothetical protein
MPPPTKEKTTSDIQFRYHGCDHGVHVDTSNGTEKTVLTVECVLVASVFAKTFHTAGGCAAKHGGRHLVLFYACVPPEPKKSTPEEEEEEDDDKTGADGGGDEERDEP